MSDEEVDNRQVMAQQEAVPTTLTHRDGKEGWGEAEGWKRTDITPEELKSMIENLKIFLAKASEPIRK